MLEIFELGELFLYLGWVELVLGVVYYGIVVLGKFRVFKNVLFSCSFSCVGLLKN